jgi:hypothetical protein
MRSTRSELRSRREFVRLAVGAAAIGPFYAFPKRTLASRKALRIAKWTHLVPEFDTWFEETAKDWGRKQDTEVEVTNIPIEQVWASAKTEAKNGAGHDIFIFPWPPAEFQRDAIDHTEIYEKVAFRYGSIPQIAALLHTCAADVGERLVKVCKSAALVRKPFLSVNDRAVR